MRYILHCIIANYGNKHVARLLTHTLAQLDRTDLKILDALQRDGRLTNAELAEKVGLSLSPCWRRLKRLEEIGVIAGYPGEMPSTARCWGWG